MGNWWPLFVLIGFSGLGRRYAGNASRKDRGHE